MVFVVYADATVLYTMLCLINSNKAILIWFEKYIPIC